MGAQRPYLVRMKRNFTVLRPAEVVEAKGGSEVGGEEILGVCEH